MPDKENYRQMVGIIGCKVEDFCINPDTTVLEAIDLLVLKNEELVSRNKFLERENEILKKENIIHMDVNIILNLFLTKTHSYFCLAQKLASDYKRQLHYFYVFLS